MIALSKPCKISAPDSGAEDTTKIDFVAFERCQLFICDVDRCNDFFGFFLFDRNSKGRHFCLRSMRTVIASVIFAHTSTSYFRC